MLTTLTEIFGVKGDFGGLKFKPQLLDSHFTEDGCAGVEFEFNGRPVSLTYKKAGSGNSVKFISVDGQVICEGTDSIMADKIGREITVILG